MLPGRQFRALDAAMQSLRAAGLRLDWYWRDKDIGWVCRGMADEKSFCELHPTQDPLIGQIRLPKKVLALALASPSVLPVFKAVLKSPVDEDKSLAFYEFDLTTTQERDLFSDFVEALQGVTEETESE